MNHFQHTVGAPLYGTEAFPTQQSQIQRFMKEVCVCVLEYKKSNVLPCTTTLSKRKPE